MSITEEEAQNKVAVEDKIDKNILLNMTEVALFLIHSLMVIDLLTEEAVEMTKTIEDQWTTDTKEDVVVQTVVSKTVVVEKELMMVTAITVVKRVILLSSVKHHLQDKEEVVTTDMAMTIERKDLSMLSD